MTAGFVEPVICKNGLAGPLGPQQQENFNMTIVTVKPCIARLPAAADPITIAVYVASTADERHASRVDAAFAAAWAALPNATVRSVGTLFRLELGGIGGPGGFGGGSTERMTWATTLGSGRRLARDGRAWTAAISDAADHLDPSRSLGDLSVEDVAAVWRLLPERDKAWALAVALRGIAGNPTVAQPWADLARAIGQDAEAGTLAGNLALRYGIHPQQPTIRAAGRLRDETIEAIVWGKQIDHIDLMVSGEYCLMDADEIVGVLRITRECAMRVYESSLSEDRAFEFTIETRSPDLVAEIMLKRARTWCEGGLEYEEFAMLHARLCGHLDTHTEAYMADRRSAWNE